ncbi:MAG: DUF1844 domain-containing protein [Nitrospinae bacterium]|nr:DUF1844 domain-containing protein [Nitrospinota bacterium]
MAEDKSFTINDRRRTAGAEETAGRDAHAAEAGKRNAPPAINFSTFVLSLSTSAAMNLGGYTDPVSGLIPRNLELAKQSIDILGILAEKTKGNLDADETHLLDSVLYELRMRYIEEMKKGA